ncbi:MAG TPA: ABC transporter ATP-binding protein [Gemmatimonadales bacterium]|nr:ABC transporter ATP-binding protein [Gemmatimonadales bacterium]
MIRLEELQKSYGGHPALEPISLEVAGGEVVALVGPNGAGKSTTLRSLAGIVHPSGGRAFIAGYDVVTDAVAARSHLGYLSQRLGVPGSTVLRDLVELVAMVRGVAPATAMQTLSDVGLGGRLGSTIGELSGGQRQRLMIVLATLGPVRALLLDEPGISLDAEGSEEVRRAICEARNRGTAVLFASHQLHDVALLADRIVVMVQGRVVAQGSLAELAQAAGVACDAVPPEPPIERIYRILVSRGRDSAASHLTLLREDAA